MEQLELTLDQLQDIRSALTARIREGLAADNREIKCLPTYLPLPELTLRGKAMVVDAGGTNMRAALVEIKGAGRVDVLAGPISERIPDGRGGQKITADAFFHAQARLMARLSPPRGLPLGYCFSYPAETLPSRDARLIRWTKGIDVPGVEGTLVGEQLKAAMEDLGIGPGRVRVLNDTVASLLGGIILCPRLEYSGRYIGLIVGTGTNMAGAFPAGQITKLATSDWPDDVRMLVNLESGNFTPPHLTTWDDAVDRATDHAGAQRFEKAVSGYYLPFLFQQVCPGIEGFNPVKGSKQLVDFRDDNGPAEARETAARLLRRSADLVAAALMAVSDLYTPLDFGILAEGSLMFGDPRYASRVEATIDRLGEGQRSGHVIQQRENTNLIGAACAALIED